MKAHVTDIYFESEFATVAESPRKTLNLSRAFTEAAKLSIESLLLTEPQHAPTAPLVLDPALLFTEAAFLVADDKV